MAIKINFDTARNPEVPTIVLAKKNGDKLGQLNAKSIEISDCLNDTSEITFNVHKYVDGKKCHLWEQIVNFKLAYCVEWDMWFEITVELDEATETVKTVFCKRLGHAELSQIMLYNIEINTENDIARDDYVIPTVLYNIEHPEASLLHRIMEKAQHYTVIHVDATIANIQRTFSFSDISIYDAFQEIAKEIGCLFVLHSNSDENGKIQRTISVYDLESYCNVCKHRGEFTEVCPECGSTDVYEGYGEDTTIFVTSDELADGIQLTTDTGSIKNCFKLEAGDDLMTATIRNCNPNGTDYLWYISDSIKADMSPELVDKLEAYDDMYATYQTKYEIDLNSDLIKSYNALITKYSKYNKDLESIQSPIIGYPSLMNAYYNTIDLAVYLQSALMPTVNISDTNAEKEAAKLTVENLSPVSVTNIEYISVATASNAILSMAKTIVDSRYRIKVETSSLDDKTKVWTGNFTVTNYSDEEDTISSEIISIVIDDNYSSFVQQKIKKALKQDDANKLSISGLFALSYSEFVLELQKYSLNCLNSFYNSCQTCIDILIEQGIADRVTWSGKEPNLYEDLYLPYLDKLTALEKEIKLRQSEIDIIIGVYDENNELKTYGLQNYIVDTKNAIQNALNFQNYVGSELWLEFCAFRREDKYSNSNYISDGLDNAELFDKANEFIRVAKDEIYKSSELQHSISSTLKNLLVIKKFKPLVDSFMVGNWLRVMVDDELYKLRLIKYSINYDSLDTINVEFSDVVRANSTLKSVQDVISQAASMATSYSSVQRQAQQGEQSNNTLKDWITNGLDATATKIIGGADNQTQTWDEHGMLFKKYDAITDSYDKIQLKIINSTLAITDDNWQTVKTAIGAYYYFHPDTGKLTMAYGVNAETIVGNLILGKNLGIHNENGDMVFNENGFSISSEKTTNAFRINANSEILLAISHDGKDVFYIDENGMLHISGDGNALDIAANSDITNLNSRLTMTNEKIESEVSRATEAEGKLSSKITQTASTIRSEIQSEVDGLNSTIAQTAKDIRSEVSNEVTGLNSKITQNANSITSEVSRAKNAEAELKSSITQTAESIRSEVSNEVDGLQSSISQNSEAIKLRVTNDEMESAITQAMDEIRLEINTGDPASLKNSSVVIDTDGIAMTGGNITVETGVSFLVNSGGTVQISAGSGDNSFINLGEAFSASKEGVSATSGYFSSLFVNGKSVLTEDNLDARIIVSTTEPDESGIIWVCPTSISKVSYKTTTVSVRDERLRLRNNTMTYAVKSISSDVLPNGTYKYTLKFTVYLVGDGRKETNIKFNVTATKANDSSLSVGFSEYTLASIYGWQEKNITLTVESAVNLCADTGNINIAIRTSGVSSSSFYVQRNSNITLNAQSVGASEGTQACNVYYKP